MIDFQSPNPIILCYPAFGGGKFISNCLSLSRHAVPQDLATAQRLLQEPDNYEFRFESVCRTLPPDRASMKQWTNRYEFGDWQIYGDANGEWCRGNPAADQATSVVEPLSKSSLRFFLVCQGGPAMAKNILQVWPNAQLLMLINCWRFAEIAIKLKDYKNLKLTNSFGDYRQEKYEELAGPDWPSWQTFEQAGYNLKNLHCDETVKNEMSRFYSWHEINKSMLLFDMDRNIFDRILFLQAMKDLYDQLEFEDYNKDLIGKFWQKYIDLHQNM